MPSDRYTHFEVERVIADDHPSLAGHFPGNPIVPGVVLLDEVAAALVQWRQGRRITGLPMVKFLAPLRSGTRFRIAFSAADQDQVRFECIVGDQVIARGRIETGPAAVEADV